MDEITTRAQFIKDGIDREFSNGERRHNQITRNDILDLVDGFKKDLWINLVEKLCEIHQTDPEVKTKIVADLDSYG